MLTQLKYGSTKESINRLLERQNQQTDSKGIDAHKYCTVISLVEDPMDIQSKL